MSTTSKNSNTLGHLLRSKSEIARVLEALVARRAVVTAERQGSRGDPFAAHIVRADASGQFIVVTTTADKPANAALLASASVTFVSRPGDWHIEFAAVGPCAVMHEGAPAIRLRYPEILTIQQRRQHTRRDVPPMAQLRCVADAGGITPFDAQIEDISFGGISVLSYSLDIALEPGTVLVGSRIELPGADAVTVDLEVRYSEVVTLPDGSRARRSGFRFVNANDGVKKLIDAADKH
jgi:c-di-GMP-binding flagellar brake protein YcgR